MNDRVIPGRDLIVAFVPIRRDIGVRPFEDEQDFCRLFQDVGSRICMGQMAANGSRLAVDKHREMGGV